MAKGEMAEDSKLSTRASWNSVKDTYFVKLILAQARSGHTLGKGLSKDAWDSVEAHFNSHFAVEYNKQQFKSRFAQMKKQYQIYQYVKDHTETGRTDDGIEIRVAPAPVWDSILEKYPTAKEFRYETLDNYEMLHEIFGGVPSQVDLEPEILKPPTSMSKRKAPSMKNGVPPPPDAKPRGRGRPRKNPEVTTPMRAQPKLKEDSDSEAHSDGGNQPNDALTRLLKSRQVDIIQTAVRELERKLASTLSERDFLIAVDVLQDRKKAAVFLGLQRFRVGWLRKQIEKVTGERHC